MCETGTEMPQYKSHKKVWALKIKEVLIKDFATSYYLVFENQDYSMCEVSQEYYRKHEPKSGGYYVVYKDGYQSFSPADAFENGYTKISGSSSKIER